MLALIKRLTLPLVLVAGLLPAGSGVVLAQSLELDLSGRNPQLRLVDPQQEELRRERREQRRYEREYETRRSGYPRCSAERALDKAERLGLRRARVTSMGRRFIEVSGRRYGERVEITFARDERCSVVG